MDKTDSRPLKQKKIHAVVLEYTQLFPQEWSMFKKSMKEARSNTTTDFAEVKSADAIDRKFGEMPETLYSSLKLLLEDDEFSWFISRDGMRWFMNTFPEFRITKSV